MFTLLAQLPAGVKTGLGTLANTALGTSTDAPAPEVLAGYIIRGFLGLIGVFFFFLAIYGGFIWMKARGNEKEVERAKDIITDGVIGIVIIFAAYVLSTFIISAITPETIPHT